MTMLHQIENIIKSFFKKTLELNNNWMEILELNNNWNLKSTGETQQ